MQRHIIERQDMLLTNILYTNMKYFYSIRLCAVKGEKI
jgi:hypothetical protein